jgi:hypothetical protein
MQDITDIGICQPGLGDLFWEGPCIVNDDWLPRYQPVEQSESEFLTFDWFQGNAQAAMGSLRTEEEGVLPSSPEITRFCSPMHEHFDGLPLPISIANSPLVNAPASCDRELERRHCDDANARNTCVSRPNPTSPPPHHQPASPKFTQQSESVLTTPPATGMQHKTKRTLKVRQTGIAKAESTQSKERYVLQCKANTTHGRRCRNAALLEFVGPQPRFCAQHIQLDTIALSHQCGHLSDRIPVSLSVITRNNRFCVSGACKLVLSCNFYIFLRSKSIVCSFVRVYICVCFLPIPQCREVVHKRFPRCHKHLGEWISSNFPSQDQFNGWRALACVLCEFEGTGLINYSSCFI